MAACVLAGLLSVLGTTQAYAGSFFWGQCTWYAAVRRPDLGAALTGNAWWWPNAAMAQGLPTGSTPQVGAVASFQPGIQGAFWTGHVGIVEKVYPNGVDFDLSEMNATCGAGCIDVRVVHSGLGVRFIY